MRLNKYTWLLKKSISTFDIRYDFGSLILFVTNKCDGGCKGCLYWPKLNNKGFKDLTLDEIKKISESLGSIWQLQVSGGEAFLRDDLAEICEFFVKNNHTRLITIPTNGLATDKIVKTTEKILTTCDCKLGMSISIDGTESINYQLRGVKGGFEKSLNTLSQLKRLSKKYKNFSVSISTRITNINLKNIPSFKKELFAHGIKVQHHIFPIRGVLKEKGVMPPTPREYLSLMNIINKKLDIINKIKCNLISEMLNNKSWPFSCVAGKRIGVIDSDGDVRLCELLKPIGNLRKNNYKFYVVWNSKAAEKQRKLIKSRRCSAGCTHGCFIWSSLFNNPWQVLKIIVKSGKSFL